MSLLSDIVSNTNLSLGDKRREIATLLSTRQVSEEDKGNSLGCAALAGDNKIVQYLLEHGCNIDAKDDYRFTVLLRLAAGKFDPCPIACGRIQAWNSETIRIVLGAYPDLHATIGRYKRTSLDWSVFNGHISLTDAILQYAVQILPIRELLAYINHPSFRRQTPLHLAVNQDNTEMVKHLLQFKVKSHDAHSVQQAAPESAVRKPDNDLPPSVADLAHPVDVNATMANGNTALHLAVEQANEEMVQIILSQPGVLANERNMLCYTPLLKAKEMNNDRVIRLLTPYALRIGESTAAARACILSEAAVTDIYTSDITTSFAETNHFTVHDVLYGAVTELQKVRTVQPPVSTNPSKKQFMKFEFQWVDLPSNNAAWAEVLLTKWCVRQATPKGSTYPEPSESSSSVQLYTESLATLFETQNVLKIHSRRLKPDCKIKLDTANLSQLLGRLYMPYLRWQTDEMQQDLRDAIGRAFEPGKVDVSSMSSNDALLQGYDIHNSTQLHLRRTLDQYRYPAMSTKERDRDQVVYRYYRYRYREVGNARWEKPRIFMVDQLWLWALPEAIITCMPEIGDGRGVRQEVIYDMNVLGDQVSHQVDLIALIFNRCLGLFDRHYPDNRELRFFEHFEWSLGDITQKATKLLSDFESDIARVTKWLEQKTSPATHAEKSDSAPGDDGDDDPSKLLFVNRLINIADETKLHFECLDMDDELVSLSKVLDQQMAVVSEFWSTFAKVDSGNDSYNLSESQQAQRARHFEILQHDQAEIKRLRTSIVDVEAILSELLSMKPRYATAIEARFTRDQAEDTARQGQVLMVFTIVTIIFLPLSFLSAFFAINISAFPKDANDQLSLGWVSKYMFGIGIGVSVPMVVMAFAFGEMQIWKERLTLMLSRKNQVKQSASHEPVPKLAITSVAVETLPRSRLDLLSATLQRRPTQKGIEKDEESGNT